MAQARLPRAGPIAITGIGLVTALGLDAITTCAAARARMSRASLLEDFPLWNSTTCQAELGTGHVIDELTRGFVGTGRLLRLGVAGLHDLQRRFDLGSVRRLGLVVNLPSDYHFARRLLTPPAGEKTADAFRQRVAAEVASRRAKVLARFLPRLMAQADVPVPSERCHLTFGDESGFAEALTEATRLLDDDLVDACVVGGVDSHSERDSLEALHALRILKSPDNPVGRTPGEAAAFVVIEHTHAAARRGLRPLALLQSCATAREPTDRFDAKAFTGEALYRCLAEVVGPLAPAERPRLVISDLNGEDYRSQEWASAMLRLRARTGFGGAAEWIPALSFGTVGAAAGPTALAMACRGFARGYAGGPSAVAWLMSDDGGRASLCVRDPATVTR